MARRHTERRVERLRSGWTSTSDLEETLAAMFQPTASVVPFPARPETTDTKCVIDTPTGGVSGVGTVPVTDLHTGGECIAPTVGSIEARTGVSLDPPPGGTREVDTEPISTVPTDGGSEMPTVGVSETPTVDDIDLPGKRPPGRELPPGGTSEVHTADIPAPAALELTAPPDTLDIRHVRLRPVRSIQDALAPGEFLLLTEMFKAAVAQPGTKDRILQGAGYRTLSERTGQDPKTVKRNRIGLCKKFCIEPLTENTFTEAAHFRILHFDTILAGWRRRGFIWVRRAGRSVELVLNRPVGASEVPTVTGIELPPVPFPNRPPEGPPQSPTVHQLETGIGKLPTATGGKTPTEGGGTSPAASISITNTTKTASPGTWPAALRALLQATGYGDDDAVRRMAEGALLNAPDATDDELAYFIRQEAPRFVRNKLIENPIGLLIRQVPRRFAGEGFRLFREARDRERAAAEAVRREHIAEARQILKDAASSDVDKEWARHVLSWEGNQPSNT